MNIIFREQKLCDLIIVCENKEFYVHKIILVNSCEFFNKMFLNNFQESPLDKITISYINAITLEILINYMYNLNIEINGFNIKVK